jgi:hypothetical protein
MIFRWVGLILRSDEMGRMPPLFLGMGWARSVEEILVGMFYNGRRGIASASGTESRRFESREGVRSKGKQSNAAVLNRLNVRYLWRKF